MSLENPFDSGLKSMGNLYYNLAELVRYRMDLDNTSFDDGTICFIESTWIQSLPAGIKNSSAALDIHTRIFQRIRDYNALLSDVKKCISLEKLAVHFYLMSIELWMKARLSESGMKHPRTHDLEKLKKMLVESELFNEKQRAVFEQMWEMMSNADREHIGQIRYYDKGFSNVLVEKMRAIADSLYAPEKLDKYYDELLRYFRKKQ